jgi:hypothetical protein
MRSWDAALLDLEDPDGLVGIARERRLVLEDSAGPRWVDLCWVDEVALSLIDLTTVHRQDLTIAYPAPAGQVAVLLAAQLLLRQFVQGNHQSSVGIVTADTTMATRTWNAVRISTTGARVPISQVFPVFRASPEGDSPGGARRLQGVIIGQACKGWPVDHLIVDRLAGPVRITSQQASIEIVADPTDPALRKAEAGGRPIWGWSEAALATGRTLEERAPHTVPFSIAAERLDTMASGIDVRLTVARHPQAEAAVARAREDLRVLRSMAPQRTDRHLERGLSAGWHHLTTLASLPCRPSRFDRFCGFPPLAARSTRGFGDELAVWAGTLSEDFAEIGSILASDVADLRAALELGNPFEDMLGSIHASGDECLVVTRTRTGAHALLDSLGLPPTSDRAGSMTIRPIGQLHRHGTWRKAVFVGEPSPWDWHRVLSGLAPVVEILTLGSQSAEGCASAIESVRAAADHWGADPVHERAWRAVVGSAPPSQLSVGPSPPRRTVVVADGAEHTPEPDPFECLSSLFDLDPLEFGGEGPIRGIARETDREGWTATVPAVSVVTDHGRLLLEVGRPVDVRDGPKLIERLPETLEPGAILLIGRQQGRVGLLEALEERLGHRPDLLAARYLLDHYRRLVRARWRESSLTIAALHRAMAEIGCDKTSHAVRSWVTDGTMAPQHIDDLERLNSALSLGMSAVQIRELFAGVQRRRGFRRAAGRALASAARDATVVADADHIDSETGLSIADLRDAVVEAVVLKVTPRDDPVSLTLIGTLEDG